MVCELLHCYSFFGVYFETLFQDVDAAFTDSLLYEWVYLIASTLDCFDYFVVVASLEGQLAMQHAVEDDSGGPDIDSSVYFVVFLVEEALGCHVGETAGI